MRRRAFIRTAAGIFVPTIIGRAQIPLSVGDPAFLGRRHRAAGGGGGSNPPLTGLRAWYKADALALSNGSSVATWTDSSGNGYDMTNANAGARPRFDTNVINGLPAVYWWASSQDHWLSPDIAVLSGLTAAEGLILLKADNTTNQGLWYWPMSSDVTVYPFGGNIYDGFMSTTRFGGFAPGVSFTTWHCYSVISAAGEWTAKQNFSQIFTSGTNTVKTTGSIGLGYSTCGGCAYHGYIAEFLFYDHKLSTTDRADVRTYLNSKYGLSL